jgi:hypothetical protein
VAVALACGSVSDGEQAAAEPGPGLGEQDGSAPPSGGSSGATNSAGSVSGGSAGFDASSGFGAVSGTQASGGTSGTAGLAGAAGTGPGGSSGTDAGDDASDAGMPCAIDFQVTTVTYNGRYSPRNIGAVWIMNPQNQFVKTLAVWGQSTVRSLVNWNQQTQGNRVDAVSSATAKGHGPHPSTWDCRDANGNVAPDGQYQMSIELTEDNSGVPSTPPTKLFSFDFTKSSRKDTLTIPDQPTFIDMVLTIE